MLNTYFSPGVTAFSTIRICLVIMKMLCYILFCNNWFGGERRSGGTVLTKSTPEDDMYFICQIK